MTYITYETAKQNNQEIITDNFDDSLGRWNNYAALDYDQTTALLDQNHVDIKSFYSTIYKPTYLIDLFQSVNNTTYLQGKSVSTIGSPSVLKAGEQWKLVASPTDTDISTISVNSWSGIKQSCTTTAKKFYSINASSPIDITSYSTNAYILISLPNYPSVDTANSYFYITTATTNTSTFNSNTDKIRFGATGVVINTTNGNTELRIPTNLLTNVFSSSNVNKGLVTGVQFEIQLTTGTADFYCSGIRCVSNNWTYAPIDINTLENAVVKTLPPNGAVVTTTLATSINESATSIVLTSASSFPSSGIILIDNEYILYDSKSSNTLTVNTVGRGFHNSFITSHNSGSLVYLYDFDYPVSAASNRLPTKWPILYRTFDSEGISSDNDPKILGGSIYGVLTTGDSFGNNSSSTNTNQLKFYFRTGTRVPTQYEINAKTQQQLNALNNINDIVPDYEEATQAEYSKIPGDKASLILDNGESYQLNPNNLPPATGTIRSAMDTFTQSQLESRYIGNIPINQITYLSTDFNWFKTTGSSVSITAASWASSKITYTAANHNLRVGDEITVSGITPSGYSGTFIVSEVVATNQFKVDYSTSLSTATLSSATFVPNNIEFKVNIADELSTLFTYSLFISNVNYCRNKTFVVKTELSNKTIECKLFELKNNQLFFINSTKKINSLFFHVNSGRFGWFINLQDGQTKLADILSNGVNYGEYKSRILNSMTPVKGGQIFANQTKNKELISEIGSNPWTINQTNGSGSLNSTIENGKKVYSITNANTYIWQGIQTNEFKIENFEDIYINFDIYFNSSENDILAWLYNETLNQFIEIHVPQFKKDQWQSLRLIIKNDKALPGNYRLVIAEDGYNNSQTWKIKNVSVKVKPIRWSMRSFVDGPWGIDDREWVPVNLVNTIPENNTFTKLTNKNDGTIFVKQDTELQIKGEAASQYAEILHFEVQPKYATPGNFTWEFE